MTPFEQQVAEALQALQEIPHDSLCGTGTTPIYPGPGSELMGVMRCTCDREERIAKGLAAAIEAAADRVNGPPGEPEGAFDRKVRSGLAAFRAGGATL